MPNVITEAMKQDLKWAMQFCLLEACKENKVLNESAQKSQQDFIKEDATYEQLLNLCFAQESNENYFEQDLLEKVAFASIVEMKINDVKLESAQAIFDSIHAIVHENKELVQEAKPGYLDAVNLLVDDAKKALASSGKYLGALAKSTGKSIEKIQQDLSGARGYVMGSLAILGAAALGAVAAYLYKQYLSKAAKACKGKAGQEFKDCIVKFKKQAAKKVVADLRKNKSACSKEADPKKCNAKIIKEIAKWQKRATGK